MLESCPGVLRFKEDNGTKIGWKIVFIMSKSVARFEGSSFAANHGGVWFYLCEDVDRALLEPFSRSLSVWFTCWCHPTGNFFHSPPLWLCSWNMESRGQRWQWEPDSGLGSTRLGLWLAPSQQNVLRSQKRTYDHTPRLSKMGRRNSTIWIPHWKHFTHLFYFSSIIFTDFMP